MELIALSDSTILSGKEAWEKLEGLVLDGSWTTCVALVDENTAKHCFPLLKNLLPKLDFKLIEIPSGEKHKTMRTCQSIWQDMLFHNLDRNALCFNLGGGVIGDMGGFCASTFMRGIDFIQVPTTLLAMVDASVGSKLGIDFNGYKNMVGMFNDPDLIMIHPAFLKTLPRKELRSGFAEMIKHLLIADRDGWEELVALEDWKDWLTEEQIFHSIRLKKSIVEQDHFESSIRKGLNYGHSFGHAVESLGLRHSDFPSLRHGESIALGMVLENIISHEKGLLPKDELEEITSYIFEVFKAIPIPKHYWEDIFAFIVKDKKNTIGVIKMALLRTIGRVEINVEVSPEEVFFALSAYNSLVEVYKK